MSLLNFLGINTDRDARDAAALGPIVMLGNDWHRRHGVAPLSMPEPHRHMPAVTRRVRLGDGLEVDVCIEVEDHGDRVVPNRVWLADPAAAVRAMEAEVYSAAMDIEDLEMPE